MKPQNKRNVSQEKMDFVYKGKIKPDDADCESKVPLIRALIKLDRHPARKDILESMAIDCDPNCCCDEDCKVRDLLKAEGAFKDTRNS